MWGPGVDREEGFIRSTVDSALRTLIGYATVCSCIWWLMSTQNLTVLNIYLLVLLGSTFQVRSLGSNTVIRFP